MEIKKSRLLGILKIVKAGVATKDVILQSSHFVFNHDHVASYNDEICVIMPFDCGFQGTVEADLLLKVISKLPSDDVELEMTDEALILKAGKSEVGVASVKESEIYKYIELVWNDLQACDWFNLDKELVQALEVCSFSAGRDRTRANLCCVRIEGSDVFSTDGVRISWYKLKKDTGMSFLIDSQHVDKIVSTIGTLVQQIALSDSWIHFATENNLVVSTKRALAGDKPLDLTKYFSEFKPKIEIEIPDHFSLNVELAETLSEGDRELDKTISLIIDEKKITLRSDSQKGFTTQELGIETKAKDTSILPVQTFINPRMLLEIIKYSSTMQIKKGMALFNSPQFQHLLALKE